MTAASAPGSEVVSPDEAWKILETDPAALLIDVRTRAEWAFVGAPDLSTAAGSMALIEWTRFPGGVPNPEFDAEARAAVRDSGANRVFFICRSGVRSAAAAARVRALFAAEGLPLTCVNVAEGFEGDLDATGRRGSRGGWKARGLPWRQS
jgi:rhodanese-related sulfurtransferase